ncbi:MAG: hypothetical protein PHQ23_02945 [Candidatus Wallbacteria bacterium]|nr:hypothetical protein [Candidatus Wallbacteria bacterium]
MEYYLNSWKETAVSSLDQFLHDTLVSLPDVIGALLVTILGLTLSFILGRAAKRFMDYTGLDNWMKKSEFFRLLSKKGVEPSSGEFLSFSVRWFIIVLTLFIAANILKWKQLTALLQSIVLYLPNVVIAIFIIGIGIVLGNQYHRTVHRTVRVLHLPPGSSRILGEMARWSILVFTTMAALNQLGVATELIRILFTGFVMMVALAGGLSFGLGCKDLVREWMQSAINNEKDKK